MHQKTNQTTFTAIVPVLFQSIVNLIETSKRKDDKPKYDEQLHIGEKKEE